MTNANEEPPEPEPESQSYEETAMIPFFTDEEIGEMYREAQGDEDYTKSE